MAYAQLARDGDIYKIIKATLKTHSTRVTLGVEHQCLKVAFLCTVTGKLERENVLTNVYCSNQMSFSNMVALRTVTNRPQYELTGVHGTCCKDRVKNKTCL